MVACKLHRRPAKRLLALTPLLAVLVPLATASRARGISHRLAKLSSATSTPHCQGPVYYVCLRKHQGVSVTQSGPTVMPSKVM